MHNILHFEIRWISESTGALIWPREKVSMFACLCRCWCLCLLEFILIQSTHIDWEPAMCETLGTKRWIRCSAVLMGIKRAGGEDRLLSGSKVVTPRRVHRAFWNYRTQPPSPALVTGCWGGGRKSFLERWQVSWFLKNNEKIAREKSEAAEAEGAIWEIQEARYRKADVVEPQTGPSCWDWEGKCLESQCWGRDVGRSSFLPLTPVRDRMSCPVTPSSWPVPATTSQWSPGPHHFPLTTAASSPHLQATLPAAAISKMQM